MGILCIGNNFSQDLTRYMHQIARADKELLNVCNLYVSGCTLAQHYQLMMTGSAAYEKAASAIGADLIVPSGKVIQELIANGISPIHRDKFHLSYRIGRYASALLWYKILTNADVSANTFNEEIDDETIQIIKKCVDKRL